MTTSDLRAVVAPYERRARDAIVSGLHRIFDVLFYGRLPMHAFLALHLLWLTIRLRMQPHAFLRDPLQYGWFIARGGQLEWTWVFGAGAAIGLITLFTPRCWLRAPGAMIMGTIEAVIAHGLTSGHYAPTGLPTYGDLTAQSAYLMVAHWFPNRRPDRKK